MQPVHHRNLKDESGRIYCCLRNKVVKLDDRQEHEFCRGCSMFAGDAEGQGVDCVWEDLRPVASPYVVRDPAKEWLSNQTRHIWPPINHLSTLMVVPN
ncbi:hypothetical protein WMW72_30275 [Paenibacillus filicis]|uniref:Uncharacterized protein n=1 Tax=Paenibacillus filicis TaxID=669464 RepID=A0ABU9DU22_9BACL